MISRTNPKDPHFKELVKALDADLAIRDGDDHEFYNQFNSLDSLSHVVVWYMNKQAVACGALKSFDENSVEVKRMYTKPEFRGKGLGSEILKALEIWAKEMGLTRCVLETGWKQPEAIQLYKKNGYTRIENYGQYKGVENSLCFEKLL
ncbi:GNAT family N-acetyltransferase [Constantimarinum furrinae]|uniref:GNAT family acetyltransferase n=1 Tax=Constantimarinum furrinae TaxID=2562285 RepID=A0A7G8PW88_9FLAO|nr:GNAT family N-acetyltransferase [Constantimarinum furrinae]QNJ98604.1 GNAT family acetyltransferase [Constantimarinum furrinae]